MVQIAGYFTFHGTASSQFRKLLYNALTSFGRITLREVKFKLMFHSPC